MVWTQSRSGRTKVRIRPPSRVANQHTSGVPQPCWPQWPDLPAGASLTIDPSRPPPTAQQHPFCDWPSGEQVPSYPPPGCDVPLSPRLSNPGCDAACAWDCLQGAKKWYHDNYGHDVPQAWIYGRAVACINKIAGLPPPPGYGKPAQPGLSSAARRRHGRRRASRLRLRNPSPRFTAIASDVVALMGRSV